MQTTPTTNSLNYLATELTSFRSWEELAEKMDNGYCPTLRPERGRSQRTQKRNAMIAELADRLESLGWPVFRGC